MLLYHHPIINVSIQLFSWKSVELLYRVRVILSRVHPSLQTNRRNMSKPSLNIEKIVDQEIGQQNENDKYLYRDFFEALFKLPDRRIQSRVLRVIGYNVTSYQTQSTQTEDCIILPLANNNNSNNSNLLQLKKVRRSRSVPENPEELLEEEEEQLPAKRSRHQCLVSTYTQTDDEQQQQLVNVLSEPMDDMVKPTEDHQEEETDQTLDHEFLTPEVPTLPPPCSLMNSMEFDFVVDKELECPTDMSDLLEMFTIGEDPTTDKIVLKDMIKELLVSKVMLETGLL